MSEEKTTVPEIFLKPYDAQTHEDVLYKMWEESGFFNPDVCLDMLAFCQGGEDTAVFLMYINLRVEGIAGNLIGRIREIARCFNDAYGSFIT